LRRRKQTPAAIERFWRVVLVSALNEELDRTDARFGIDVFWKAFLANRTGYRMGIPSVPLSELYDGCRIAIEKKGGEVTLRSPVRSLRLESGALKAAVFDGGKEEAADSFILALRTTASPISCRQKIRIANPALSHLERFQSIAHHRRAPVVRSRNHPRIVHHVARYADAMDL